jgi:hypothetical protein
MMTEIEMLCATLNTLGVSYETGVEDVTGFPFVKFDFGDHGHACFNMECGTPWISVSGDVKSMSDVAEALLGRYVS